MITLQAPASKSVSHRTLIAAALAHGSSQVHHVLSSADLERTRDILQAAGAVLKDLGDGSWSVQGVCLPRFLPPDTVPSAFTAWKECTSAP